MQGADPIPAIAVMLWPSILIGVPTAVPTEPVTAFGNIDQRSVIITVILSIGGLAWAINCFICGILTELVLSKYKRPKLTLSPYIT